MTKRISGAEYPLSKIFSSEFDYVIPSYQRPYAWTHEQAGELFSDLYDFYSKEDPQDTYFLGSIVLIKEEDVPKAEVIDGQQRLTTITILLALLTQRSFGSIRESFHKYIREPGNPLEDLEEKPRLRLRDRDSEFFERYIQDVDIDGLVALDPAQLDSEAKRNIRANALFFRKKLDETFGNDSSAANRFGSFILQRCFMVAVSTPTQQSAFRVFSILNSRGLDLLPTDIIKSQVIGKVAPVRRDDYNEIWEELEIETGRGGFAEVFGHIRMIYAKEKARRALLEEFAERVVAKTATGEALIDEVIEPYTSAYLIAKHADYTSTGNAAEINALLKWLNRIDNSDWLPSAMSFLAQYASDAAYVKWFFEKLERLAAYMHICGLDVNQRMVRYAMVLQELESPSSLANPLKQIELTEFEKKRFLEQLSGNVYDMKVRRRNYLILRLDSFISDAAAVYDPSILTIEHVLPQTVKTDSVWTTQWPNLGDRIGLLHCIANLVPLNRRRNSQAQNYDFEKKKKAYFMGTKNVSSYALTSQVLGEKEWTPAVVQKRQVELLGRFASAWELN